MKRHCEFCEMFYRNIMECWYHTFSLNLEHLKKFNPYKSKIQYCIEASNKAAEDAKRKRLVGLNRKNPV